MEAARLSMVERLFDSLLHDARNPLNALVINLDVLTEKLRKPEGQVPPNQEKNLRAIREQAFRVDGILRTFSESLLPAPESGPGDADFSTQLIRAHDLLGHEIRRNRVKTNLSIQPNVRLAKADPRLCSFLSIQPLLRSIARSAPGEEVFMILGVEQSEALLQIRDVAPGAQEPFPEGPAAIAWAAQAMGGSASVRAGECLLRLPVLRTSKENNL